MTSAISTAIMEAAPMLTTTFGDAPAGKGKFDLSKFSGSLGDILGALGSMQDDNKYAYKNYQAYQDYLGGIANSMANALEGRADKYDQKLTNLYNTNQGRFDTEANSPLPELEGLKQDLINQSYETAGANRRQIEAELARQGVRGGQAGIIAARNLGQTTKDLQHQLNQLTYNEALNRQNARLSNYSQGSLIPLKSLSGAYGNSLASANKALSDAQGNVYQGAYGNMMNNFMSAQKPQKNKFGNILKGAASGAAAGSTLGGWGTAGGALIGGAMGAIK